MVVFKNIHSYLVNTSENTSVEERDVMSDVRYIRKSCVLITEALQKGCDVMHMPNGDIIITEVRTMTYQYTWDAKKGKMVRVQSGARLKKARARKEKVALVEKVEVDMPVQDMDLEDEMFESLLDEAV